MDWNKFLKYIGAKPVKPLSKEETEQFSLRQGLKNLVGDFLGYARCPVTNDTYWKIEIAAVHYTENQGVGISARALRDVPAERIAQVVFDRSRKQEQNYRGERLYSLDEIMRQLPDGCFIFPRK